MLRFIFVFVTIFLVLSESGTIPPDRNVNLDDNNTDTTDATVSLTTSSEEETVALHNTKLNTDNTGNDTINITSSDNENVAPSSSINNTKASPATSLPTVPKNENKSKAPDNMTVLTKAPIKIPTSQPQSQPPTQPTTPIPLAANVTGSPMSKNDTKPSEMKDSSNQTLAPSKIPTTQSTAKPTTPKPSTAQPTTPKPSTAQPTTLKPSTAQPTLATTNLDKENVDKNKGGNEGIEEGGGGLDSKEGGQEGNYNFDNSVKGNPIDDSKQHEITGGGKKVQDYTYEEESSGAGHFMAYFLTAVVLCVAGYVIFHNKQKIVAFIVEGRNGRRSSRRPNKSGYKKLTPSGDDVLPKLEKSTSSSQYIY